MKSALIYSIAFVIALLGFQRISSNYSHSNLDKKIRPLVHALPNHGWMNDPNGLWYDAKERIYHLYFQYNPNDTVWGRPLFWGHSISDDLTRWNYSGIAISPGAETDGAYSGSAVVDSNNTSGFFNSSVDPRQRVVAIWTLDQPGKESQYLSYSLDGGYTFIPYENNPVLDINSTQFRDPKVLWHEESKKWILIVAHSQKYEILIYSSENLKDWDLKSSFSYHGYLGYQYECPSLAEVPIVRSGNNKDLDFSNISAYGNSKMNMNAPNNKLEKAWVLFISINPSAPQGGSATQYFVGDFNGTHFVPFTTQTRFVDLGKDYYALQTFFNTANKDDVLAIAWASNWQYGLSVPTKGWRSSMSLVRNFTLRAYKPNPESIQMNLNSEPILAAELIGNENSQFTFENHELTKRNAPHSDFEIDIATGLYEFEIIWSVNFHALNITHLNQFTLTFNTKDTSSEYLVIGYEAVAGAFYVDRGNSLNDFVSENPFFNNKHSVFLEPYGTFDNENYIYKVYGVIDVNILELYFNDGSSVTTNLFFLSDSNGFTGWEFSTNVDEVFTVQKFKFNILT